MSIALHTALFARVVTVHPRMDSVPDAAVDKHRNPQIQVNVLSNANGTVKDLPLAKRGVRAAVTASNRCVGADRGATSTFELPAGLSATVS